MKYRIVWQREVRAEKIVEAATPSAARELVAQDDPENSPGWEIVEIGWGEQTIQECEEYDPNDEYDPDYYADDDIIRTIRASKGRR